MNDIKAVLLVGGLGTRLQSVVPSTPKALAAVGNKPFLELLVRQLRYQGIRHLVMCTGYLSDQIENEFRDGTSWDVAIEYSIESHPLGTAGALKLSQNHLRDSPDFLVMNGDSFSEIDFHQLLRFHREHSSLVTMAVLHVENPSRYGTVEVSTEKLVTGFIEKSGGGVPGLINTGVYVFNRAIFERIPDGIVSLEKDVFPRLLGQRMFALQQHGMFIDIGTPEDYARAQVLCERLYNGALPEQMYTEVRDR
jgi:D-glycero-alpha-D-manno-heptose 1-phosphate guanylyltransferase